MMNANEKKEKEGRLPRQIFACSVLEQAIQLTASTPEMSTGYLDFSV